MERTTSELHGKHEEASISHETMSTSSEGKVSQTSKGAHRSLYEFSVSPSLQRPHKRAKSLKVAFRKANIDYPEMQASGYRSILSPLPEPVEEDESEDSYVFLLVGIL